MQDLREQRAHARLAGICFLANYVPQMLGDSVTIILRKGETFVERARYVREHPRLWRVCLLGCRAPCPGSASWAACCSSR